MRCVIVTGADPAFCSGDDVREIMAGPKAVSKGRSPVVRHKPTPAAMAALTAEMAALEKRLSAADLFVRDPKAFAAHLNKVQRLTASLLLRSLAHGHMTFFECAVAELAGVPHHRTWLMIHDAGPLGLRAIYDRAGLPARLFGAFRAGVDTFHSMEFDGGLRDRERFQERMLQRFLTQPQGAARDDVDYLIDKMDRISREARRTVDVA